MEKEDTTLRADRQSIILMRHLMLFLVVTALALLVACESPTSSVSAGGTVTADVTIPTHASLNGNNLDSVILVIGEDGAFDSAVTQSALFSAAVAGNTSFSPNSGDTVTLAAKDPDNLSGGAFVFKGGKTYDYFVWIDANGNATIDTGDFFYPTGTGAPGEITIDGDMVIEVGATDFSLL